MARSYEAERSVGTGSCQEKAPAWPRSAPVRGSSIRVVLQPMGLMAHPEWGSVLDHFM